MRPSIGYSAKSQWADIADLSCSASPLLPRKGIDAATNWSGRTRDRRSDRNRPCAPAPNACGPSTHAATSARAGSCAHSARCLGLSTA